jgi:hypothetical protein
MRSPLTAGPCANTDEEANARIDEAPISAKQMRLFILLLSFLSGNADRANRVANSVRNKFARWLTESQSRVPIFLTVRRTTAYGNYITGSGPVPGVSD